MKRCQFFWEQFEQVISEIKQKFQNDSDLEKIDTDPQKYRQEMLENKITAEKKDMWDD